MSNTALLFLFLFFAGLVLAFVKHPIYGILSYMLVLYMGPGESWWSTNIPDLRWSLLGAAATIIAVMFHPSTPTRPAWYRTAPIRWLILFALWLWIQTPWALRLEDHLFMALLFSKYVILYAVLYTSLSDPRNIRLFFFAHIVGCFFWGYTAYLYPGHGRLETLGFGDLAGSPFASMQLETGLAFAGFAFLGASGVWRWLAFSSIPFNLNAVILMATRGAFVGLVAGAIAATFFTRGSLRRSVVLCVSLGAILLLALAHDLFWSRMSTILPDETGAREASAESRIVYVKANLQMFRDHPFGVGHRGNETLSPLYMPAEFLTEKEGAAVRAAHNTIMAVLVDHGFIGLVLFALFHISIARSLVRIKFRPSSSLAREFGAYAAALAVSWVIYWGNGQFVNLTKAEVIIWIAALAVALEWIANTPEQSRDAKPAAVSSSGREVAPLV